MPYALILRPFCLFKAFCFSVFPFPPSFSNELAKSFFADNFFIHCLWRVWPGLNLLVWHAVYFYAMHFRDNNDGEFYREHAESCLSTTKNIVSPPPQCLWPPDLASCWLTMRGPHPWNHVNLIPWSCSITWQFKSITTIVPLATCFDGFLPTKSHDAVITWSCKVTRLTVISPFTLCLWSPNLIAW